MRRALRSLVAVTAGIGLAGLSVTLGCSPDLIAGKDQGGSAISAGQEKRVELVAGDYKFTPAEITAAPKQRLRVTLTNRDNRAHGLTFDLPGGLVKLDTPAGPGLSQTLELTAPDKPGSYAFYCPLGSSRSMGMEGRLIVKLESQLVSPTDSAGQPQPYQPQPYQPPPAPPIYFPRPPPHK